MLDEHGYLKNYEKWTEEIAIKIALKEKIKLKNKHWKIIYIIRKFYIKFNRMPSMLEIHIIFKKKNKKTINLNELFNQKFIKISSKIAGIPKTNICI
ncbi:TusE/DsrC/DsvC family sulfur relay protein [Buchnera aphidicola (Chaitoregma tattakana)]|uniref:TusE/DsrC/DsvC family sulfur relay protein n=1 Tax=Buchnera aphidicola TaxID=9 RepID=UPI0031B87C6C